jgi:hypothetical protein
MPSAAAVQELTELRVTDKFTNYIAETTIHAVDTALGYQSIAWNRTSLGSRRVPFKRFVWDVIRRAAVKMPVLLTTLVYITRAKSHLHIETEDWACERVFLGALMVASKVRTTLSSGLCNCAHPVIHSTLMIPPCGTFIGLLPPLCLANET